MEDVSRGFWRSAAAEFRAKIKSRESALRAVEVDIPKSARRLFTQVLRQDIDSITQAMRQMVAGQRHFTSPENREQLLNASYRRVCQILKTVQDRKPPETAAAADALQAAERFLHRLSMLKALIERKSQTVAALESETVPRLNTHEVLLLMFNSVLKAMCHAHWYPVMEDEAPLRKPPATDELSLATTI
jgi:hypothetical protein